MTTEEQLRIITELSDSPAWQLIRRTMLDEIERATRAHIDPSRSNRDDLNFERGAIWAAYRLVGIPERLKALLENQLLMERADKTVATSAKAERKRIS